MPLFIMATRLTGEEIHPTLRLEEKEHHVMRAVDEAGLDIDWISSYAITGPYDYIDVLQAADIETAMKACLLVRSMGRAHTELWNAAEWKDFKKMLVEIPKTSSAEAHQ